MQELHSGDIYRGKMYIRQFRRNFARMYNTILGLELPKEEEASLIQDWKTTVRTVEGNISGEALKLGEIPEPHNELDSKILGLQYEPIVVDTNVIETLVEIYVKKAKMPFDLVRGANNSIYESITLKEDEAFKEIDTTELEKELREYFTNHYYDLLSDGYNVWLSIVTAENGELTNMAIRHGLDPKVFHLFGYQLTVQEGLVAEEDPTFGRVNIFYATPEAIIQRINDLYDDTIIEEKVYSKKESSIDKIRKVKSQYITYAEQKGIEIQDRTALEELPVDMNKVRDIASFINRVLRERGLTTQDLTEDLMAEIQKKYPKIMNLSKFNFNQLETVKNVSTIIFSELLFTINKDSIVRDEGSSGLATVVYGTPDFLKREYRRVQAILARKDHFAQNFDELRKKYRMKDELRRYIKEHGIEEIDISIPNIEVDHQKTELIAEAIIEQYGKEYEDKEGIRAKLLKKIEDRYPELCCEIQIIALSDLVGEELKEMGWSFSEDKLFVQENFVYLGTNYSGRCLYATPAAIKDKIKVLHTSYHYGKTDRERREVELVEYARNSLFKNPNLKDEEIKKMLDNSTAKKYTGKKKRATREEERQDYRQRLIAAGKGKTIKELDNELRSRQDEEQQLKQLYKQYQDQLPDKQFEQD